MNYKQFATEVMNHYRTNGRHDLPWRKTHDPYRILVSEMMLQQTQVERVVPLYQSFLAQFPDAHTLARAPLSAVLKLWNGLGYNRRAKFLHEAAKVIDEKGMPETAEELQSLPGVGPYTASAIAAFAFDNAEIVIETNIRAALIHHFFSERKDVSDSELVPILRSLLRYTDSPREWYSAFMDYGAHIKKTHPNPSRRSAHHAKQSKFEGSARQVRGAIVRLLSEKACTANELAKLSGFESERVIRALESLLVDGLIVQSKKRWRLGGE